MEKQQQKGQEVDLLLPSELNYDDLFAEGNKWTDDGDAAGLGFAFPSEIPFLFASNPVSPADSVTETETESDEDCLAGLTQRMAHSFLHDDDGNSDASFDAKLFTAASDFRVDKPKPTTMAVSPQSTLCTGWSVSNGLPPVNSSLPLSQKRNERAVALGLQDLQQLQQLINHHQQIKRLRSVAALPYQNTAGSICEQQLINHHRPVQFPLMNSRHPAVRAGLNKARSGTGVGVGNYRALGLPSSAWPPLQKHSSSPSPRQQQQPTVGSGMRAVFLNSPAIKKESAGTGVFLPRIPTIKAKPPRRKPACSPVLVPARVVHALNLNLDHLDAQPGFTNASAYAEYVLNREMVNNFVAYHRQKGNLRPRPAVVASGDVHLLPHEWTY